MPTWLEQTVGVLLLTLVLLDVFLDVLYARLGTGILAPRISQMIWRLFLAASRPMGKHRRVAMSFCGPVIVGGLVVTWALGLTLGTALIIHPVLGTAVRANSGATPTDFLTAMYVGGSSVSIVGGANFSPQTGAFKAFFTITSLAATFLSRDAGDPRPPSAEEKERWGRRYRVALRRLQQAGIRTIADEQAGARHYVALRAEWDGAVGQLASALSYTREEIDRRARTRSEWRRRSRRRRSWRASLSRRGPTTVLIPGTRRPRAKRTIAATF